MNYKLLCILLLVRSIKLDHDLPEVGDVTDIDLHAEGSALITRYSKIGAKLSE